MEPRLVEYLYCFNILRDYYECHEFGESLWLDTGRPVVLKGLIQAAVCLYHLHNGNVKGGYRMWQRAKQYLHDSLPTYESMDLAALVADIDAVFALVPRDWYTAVLPPSDIERLNLPTVSIRILDPDVDATLPSLHGSKPGHL